MKTPLRILHLEDTPHDRALVQAIFEAEGIACVIQCVETRSEFLAALEEGAFDLILADHTLPTFDGLSALSMTRARRPDLPFLFVTGSMGEELATQTMKNGATDYVLKNRIGRLVPSVRRAVLEAKEREEHKRAERRIREQATLLDEAQDAIIVRDLDHRITYWNKGAMRLYGWSPKEALGQPADEFLQQESSPQVEEAHRTVLEKGEWHGELQQVTKTGARIVVMNRKNLLRDEEGKAYAILNISTDITEKKRLEAQYLRAQRMESIGTLAGGIAHDLNNILAPVLMATQLLRMKLTEPADLKLLDTVESSAQRGAGMVKQILSFARGVQGERTILQIRHLVKDMVKVAKETFPASIHIRTQTVNDLWTTCGDATQLYQVLMNLCVNARDAMPNGGNLEITMENVLLDKSYASMHPEAKVGPYVVLAVIDSGTGIAPHILDKIFDPFFTTKEIGKGSGLGLSTSLGIVRSHGGFMTVYSELNKGTLFKVYLPASELAETQKITPIPDLLHGKGELILVVDDERAIREIMRGTLEHYGYRVLTANDGTEALAHYAQHLAQINAVITDMAMPFMDGQATIRALQRMNPHVKIIATSGFVEHSNITELARNGPVSFLQKPFTTENLLARLISILSGGEPESANDPPLSKPSI